MSAREWPCLTTLSCTGKSGRAMQGVTGDARKAPTPSPKALQNSLSHPPFSSALFLGGGAAFCSANRQSSLQSLPVPPLHSCMQPRASFPFLSTPLLSIPLLCCGERAKARKALTGSLECLQAIREMISAVKESLFQVRVNSLFILAFAARRD